MVASLGFASSASAASLSGTVTDAVTHAAVANECVTAYGVNGALSIASDSSGRYTLSGLAAGTYKVGFQSCGGGNYQPQYYNNKPSLATADPVVLAADAATSGIDAALQPGGQITGTVTDATTGAPVAGECVSAAGPNNSPGGFASTDTAGHYTIAGLATGTYTVFFSSCSGGNYLSQYYKDRTSSFNADPVTVTAGATTDAIDAALQQGGQITGTVTSDVTGAPLAGVCVNASGPNGGGGFASTDGSGHYTVSGLAAGNYTVGFQPCAAGNYVPQYYNNKASSSTADPVTVTAGNATSGIDAALQPGGRITGTVTDAATGAPVAGECVSAVGTGNGPGGATTTDASGQYTVGGLAPGTYTVGFRSCGGGSYLPQYYNNKPSSFNADPVTVTAGNTTSGIDAALRPGGQITGTVTSAATGGPVAGECVSAALTPNNIPAGFASTDAAGHYTISGLGAGGYTVSFSSCSGGNYVSQYYNNKASQANADVVTVTGGATTADIDAVLQAAGQISGTVTDAATGAPVAGECVIAGGANGAPGASAQTDASGHYTLSGLSPGSYTVAFQSCSGGRYLPQYYDNKPSAATADSITVTTGATTSGIDAALQSGGQITGTVTDAVTHVPISGACVGLYDTADNLVTFAFTNGAGQYTLTGLATGSYKVGFAKGGSLCPTGPGDYQPQFYDARTSFATADPVSIIAGATTPGIDAALQPAGDTPPDTPAAPASNQAVNNDGNHTLSWGAVTDPDGDSVDHYVLQHERYDQTSFTDVATVSGTSYRFGADGPSEGEGTWTYRVIAVDSRGTHSAPSDPSTPVVVDETPPNPPTGHTVPSAAYVDPATGTHWYRDSVTVSFSANGDPALVDGSPGSGVASVTAARTFDSSNADPRTGSVSQDGRATDHAGNVSAATTVAGAVDWAAPAASFSTCPSHVLLHSTDTALWTASDPAPSSGLATAARGLVTLETGSVGVHTVRSPAPADNVGHIGNAAGCTYTVVYAFHGFSDPVTDPPGVNGVQAGSTVPLKWQLTDAHGNDVSALSAVTSITYKPTGCDSFTNDPAGAASAAPSGGTGLRYDAAGHQYVFNWRAPGPGCYSLFLTLDSGQVEPAYFQVTGRTEAHRVAD